MRQLRAYNANDRSKGMVVFYVTNSDKHDAYFLLSGYSLTDYISQVYHLLILLLARMRLPSKTFMKVSQYYMYTDTIIHV